MTKKGKSTFFLDKNLLVRIIFVIFDPKLVYKGIIQLLNKLSIHTIMKKYSSPRIAILRKGMDILKEIDIYSRTSPTEQLGNESTFEEETLPSSKSVWN